MHLIINTTKPFASIDAFLDWLLQTDADRTFATNIGTVSRCVLWQLIELVHSEKGNLHITTA